MSRSLAVVSAAALLTAGCARTEIRYAPPPAEAFASGRLAPIASIEIKDASDGLHSEGAGLTLSRPFFAVFRDAVSSQLGALKVAAVPGGGAVLGVELTSADVRRGRGFAAELASTVKYSLIVRRGARADCRQDAVGWATMKEGFASSPAAETLRRALARAMENLGPALAASCLADPGAAGGSAVPAAPAAPALPRDPKTWALIVGVGRSRGKPAAAASAEEGARSAAEFAKTTLGVPDDQVVLIVDEMATLADLQKYVQRWIPERVGPDGKVFVAFFGRAAAPAKGPSVLLPFDGDADYPQETGLPLARLGEALGRLPGRADVVLGIGAGAVLPSRLPNGVRFFPAESDLRSAFQAARDDWRAP